MHVLANGDGIFYPSFIKWITTKKLLSFLLWQISHVVCMMIRSPAVSRIRAKMLYATSKDRFKRELDGIHYEIQATDPTEMDLEVIRDRAH